MMDYCNIEECISVYLDNQMFEVDCVVFEVEMDGNLELVVCIERWVVIDQFFVLFILILLDVYLDVLLLVSLVVNIN